MSNQPPRWPTVVVVVSASVLGLVLGVLGTLIVVSLELTSPVHPPEETAEWGEFPTAPRVELLDDGRLLRLLEDFVYVDPRGRVWTADKDSVVNGASIPQVFWSVVGGPLEGKYRNASIVHDEACGRMTESWENVHLMFYEACRCGGVSESKSKVLYAAVYHFGPRWDITPVREQKTLAGPDGKRRVITITRTVPGKIRPMRQPPPLVGERLEEYIRTKNPSLTELKNLDPDAL